MNTIPASDTRTLIHHLDRIKELTDLLRRAHYDVPTDLLYGAVGGEAGIRKTILGAAVTSITIEPPNVVRKIAITVPATQTEVV